jgi:hypothetical protein
MMPRIDRPPLSSLLSQALVAFTIELDNEAEHRGPHRTTRHGATSHGPHAPWLASMVMWFNCMRFVGEDGVAVRELERKARTPTNLEGMKRWGYITVAPDPTDPRPKPPKSAWIVRATAGGRMGQKIFPPLLAEMEKRWEERFGIEAIARLRETLASVVRQVDRGLPDCLPILGYGLRNDDRLTKLPPADSTLGHDGTIPLLLAKVLLAFALDFERESDISLAIYANLLRILNESGVRVRDLPTISGVSKESLNMAMGILLKKDLVVVGSSSKSGKVARLTAVGVASQQRCRDLLATVEEDWSVRFGTGTLAELREPLAKLAGDGTPKGSALFKGLEPYPEGWRAAVRRPSTLPQFPMVLHRGGFPDGS